MIEQQLLAHMNEKQREAVLHTEGPLLVMAGAGSGKTRVLTHRIAYLMEQHHVPSTNILAITFTNKAAKEMKERLVRLVGEQAQWMWISTFHSMCVRILRQESEKLGYKTSFGIADPAEQQSLMKQIVKRRNLDPDKHDPRMILHAISQAKNELQTPKEYQQLHTGYIEKITGACYEEYQKELKKNQTMDFDDLIMLTVQLFEQFPHVLAHYQQKFHYIHVDEYQDTNEAQYKLVQLLAGRHHNICVVGDADQSIYGWRGANMENILNFEKDYPTATVVLLEQNYRSTQTILQAANDVIGHNKKRKEKNLWTQNDKGEAIHYYRSQDERDEARFIVDQIRHWGRNGKQLRDIAVLYRANAQSRAVEDALVKSNIAYRMVGGHRFYDRLEIKDILAYLRLLVNPDDDMSFRRIINTPKRGMGDKTIEKLSQFAALHQWSLLEASHNAILANMKGKSLATLQQFAQLFNRPEELRFSSLAAFVEEFLYSTGYIQQYELNPSLENQARLENIQEFLTVVQQFEKERVLSDTQGNAALLVEFLTDVSLLSDSTEEEDAGNAVTLMTLHAAKGLEFPVVFMIGMEDGIFPSRRSFDEENKLEEERRLAYVGITRAEEVLYVTNAYRRTLYGDSQSNPESMFLKEIRSDIIHTQAAATAYSFYDSFSKRQQYKEDVWSSYQASTTTSNRTDFSTFLKKKPVASSEQKTLYTSSIQKTQPTSAQNEKEWAVGDRVYHKKWGEGTIVKKTGSGKDLEVDVAFPSMGIKRLLASYAPIEKL